MARRHLAGHQKGAQVQQQTILFIDESGFDPLPSVVRTYAPIGHTPIVREWYTRDHLSAISALSPAGKRYFHAQDHAMNSVDVVAFLEHLLREVPARMIIIWDGAPIHRSQVIKTFLANGAAQRMHLERLPAYAPDLNPGEGLWEQLKGVELRTSAASISRTCGMSCVTRSNGFGANHVCFKAFSKEQDFRSLRPGQ